MRLIRMKLINIYFLKAYTYNLAQKQVLRYLLTDFVL